MITLILMLVTAYLAFQIGRRYETGQEEVVTDRVAQAREARGRRGAMKLRPIKIRR